MFAKFFWENWEHRKAMCAACVRCFHNQVMLTFPGIMISTICLWEELKFDIIWLPAQHCSTTNIDVLSSSSWDKQCLLAIGHWASLAWAIIPIVTAGNLKCWALTPSNKDESWAGAKDDCWLDCSTVMCADEDLVSEEDSQHQRSVTFNKSHQRRRQRTSTVSWWHWKVGDHWTNGPTL